MDITSALIVDDSKMARITLKKQLENRNINVYLAASGEESLDFLKTNLPDMIFMDCMMPGIDGFKATQEIKSNPDTSSIPVVMCTGKETDEDKQRAFASGAVGYMKKTSSLEPLNDVLYEISHLDEHSHAAPVLTATESVATTRPAAPDMTEMTRITEQSVNTMAASLKEQYRSELNSKINELAETIEQKLLVTAEASVKEVHSQVNAQIERLNKETLPELKNDTLNSLTDLISESLDNRLQPLLREFEQFKSAINQLDIEKAIEQQVHQQTERHFQQNLSTYAAKIMEDEAGRIVIDAMIQERLSEHKDRLDTLEQLSAVKHEPKLNNLSLLALAMGGSALLMSIYQLL